MEDRKWREPLSSILYPPSSRLSSGDPSAVAPPVPIPNTEVKRCSPDGSATIGCARVGRRQNKNPAGYSQRGFCFVAPARPEDETLSAAVSNADHEPGALRQGLKNSLAV